VFFTIPFVLPQFFQALINLHRNYEYEPKNFSNIRLLLKKGIPPALHQHLQISKAESLSANAEPEHTMRECA